MLIRMIYVSSATTALTTAELKNILSVAQRNNQKLGITGMLLFAEGNFIQVLEGEAEDVHSLYQKIEQDPRHTGAIVIDEEPTASRAFSQWSMGFRHISKEDKAGLVGFSDFLLRKMAPEEFLLHRDEVADLLYQFAKTNSR